MEHIPDGYQVGRIFCGYTSDSSTPPSSWDEYSYSDGWTVPNPSGQYVYCYIFDVPTRSSVPGFTASQDSERLESNLPARHVPASGTREPGGIG